MGLPTIRDRREAHVLIKSVVLYGGTWSLLVAFTRGCAESVGAAAGPRSLPVRMRTRGVTHIVRLAFVKDVDRDRASLGPSHSDQV